MATINTINSSEPIEVGAGGIGAATLTDHGILVGSGTGALTALTVGTHGQVLVGSTGADPVMATIDSDNATITFSPGAASLNIESVVGDAWSEYTGTATTIAVNTAKVANNAAEIRFVLPSTSSVGDTLSIAGKGAGAWKLAQAAGQTIHLGANDTITGITGNIASVDQFGAANLVCSVANTDWVVRNIEGDVDIDNTYPKVWTSQTSNFSGENVRSIDFDGTTFCAAGYAGKMSTATDPTGTWTARTSSFGATNIFGVDYCNATWIAGGSGGTVATASSPTGTWTQRTSPHTSTVRSFAYGDGVYVSVGSLGQMATATDPTGTWTARTSSFGATTIYQVQYLNGIFIACGDDGKIATSTTPTGTWTQRSNPMSDWIYKVIYEDGLYIAVGTNTEIATASDPTSTWTLIADSSFSSYIDSIAYNNGVYTACGDSGEIATATDPEGTWTQQSNTFTDLIYDNVVGAGYWVCVGQDGEIETSPILT